MCPFCPRGCSVVARAHGPSNPGLVKNGPPGARCGSIRPGTAPSRTGGTSRGSLDQWSRPSARAPGAHPESPIPMPSCSVKPAGNRHSCGDTPLMPRAGTPVTSRGCAGRRRGVPRRWCRRLSPLEAVSPLVTSVCTRFRVRLRGSAETAAACRRILACPASWGQGGHSRAGRPGADGFPAPGTVAPARGLCAPGWAYGRVRRATGS
jgi:hypothetical protein